MCPGRSEAYKTQLRPDRRLRGDSLRAVWRLGLPVDERITPIRSVCWFSCPLSFCSTAPLEDCQVPAGSGGRTDEELGVTGPAGQRRARARGIVVVEGA